MKSRRPLIHIPLYLDSLKQLLLMGGIYALICIVFSILPVVLIDPDPNSFGKSAITITSYNFVLFGYVYIAPMTLIHQAFGYLTKRSPSDFYHSLPVTRNCLFLTRLVAVLTILFVTIVLSLLASFVAYSLSGMAVNWLCFPRLLLFFSVCALLIAAVTLVGLSVTGTHFAGFIVSCLLLFLPRFLSTMVAAVVLEKASIVEIKELGWLFNASYNLPVALLMPILSLGEASTFVGRTSDLITGGKGLLYTFLLSLIYTDLGMILHHYRKSETAGLSAPSKVLQHIIRCALALPLFTVLGVLAVIGEFFDEPFWTWVLIALAFLVYFIYELITTKKWRNLLPALYVLPIVLVLGFGIPYAGTFVAKNALNDVPDASEIQSVNLHVNSSQYSSSQNYYRMLLQKQECSDKELNGLLLKGLEQGIAHCNATADGSYSPNNSYYSLNVRFNLKNGKALTREVYLDTDDFKRIQELEASYDFYRSILSKTPDPALVSFVSCSNLVGTDEFSLMTLYETFREEYASLPFEEKLLGLTEASSGSSIEPEEYAFNTEALLWVSGSMGYDPFSVAYRITSLTPKTLSMLMKQSNDQYYEQTMASFASVRERLVGADESNLFLHLYGTVTFYDSANGINETFDLTNFDSSNLAEADKLLELLSQGIPTSDLDTAFVSLANYGIDVQESSGDGEWLSGEGCAMILPDDVQSELYALLENQ